MEEGDKFGLASSDHACDSDAECPGVQQSMRANQAQLDYSLSGEAAVNLGLVRTYLYGPGCYLAYNQPSEDVPESRRQRTGNSHAEPFSSVDESLALAYQFGPGGQAAYKLTCDIDSGSSGDEESTGPVMSELPEGTTCFCMDPKHGNIDRVVKVVKTSVGNQKVQVHWQGLPISKFPAFFVERQHLRNALEVDTIRYSPNRSRVTRNRSASSSEESSESS
jgi:hypothetical protein